MKNVFVILLSFTVVLAYSVFFSLSNAPYIIQDFFYSIVSGLVLGLIFLSYRLEEKILPLAHLAAAIISPLLIFLLISKVEIGLWGLLVMMAACFVILRSAFTLAHRLADSRFLKNILG